MRAPANFTQLLTEWRSGHPQALERLTPLVYDELRRLARNYMRGERGGHTLQATAVVHEAFLRLIQANVALQDRAHFFALASRLMRRVLVDHAKSRSRMKRNAGELDMLPAANFDVLALDDAERDLDLVFPHADGEIGMVGAVVIEHSAERRTRENVSVNYEHCIVELFQ